MPNAELFTDGCLVFAATLVPQTSLDVFLAMDDYLTRRAHLIDVWKSGVVSVPKLEGIDPSLLPADFL